MRRKVIQPHTIHSEARQARARTSKERKRDDAQAARTALKTLTPAKITGETLIEYAERIQHEQRVAQLMAWSRAVDAGKA